MRVDVIYGRLSQRAQAWIDLLGGLLFLLPFSAFALLMSWPAVRDSFAVREMSPDPGGLARYPIKAAVLPAFALLWLQGLSEVLKRLAILRGSVRFGLAVDPMGFEAIDEYDCREWLLHNGASRASVASSTTRATYASTRPGARRILWKSQYGHTCGQNGTWR